MKKIFIILAAVLTVLISATVVSADTVTIPITQNYKLAQETLKYVNKERAKAGLGSLTLDKDLTKHAITRAAELSVMIPWTSPHMRPNGTKNSGTRVGSHTISYECCQERTGTSVTLDASTVVKDWMSSPAHRAGILLSSARSIGIAFVDLNGGEIGHYVLEFSNTSSRKVEKSKKRKSMNVKVNALRTYLPKSVFSAVIREIAYPPENAAVQIYARMECKKGIARYRICESNFKWKSSDSSVATVSKNGVVSPKKLGNVTFTGTYKSNKKIKLKVKYTVTENSLEMYDK